MLLQVLDDGRLTDNKGRIVNFKNTIIIMTSNMKEEQLLSVMRPEFRNRIDETIFFKELTRDEISQIVEIQLKNVSLMLYSQGIEMKWTPAAVNYIADKGYDPLYGARPVKRTIQHLVLDDMSKAILDGSITREKPIVVDANSGGLYFHM